VRFVLLVPLSGLTKMPSQLAGHLVAQLSA
jgi:hypothetical protein